MDRENPGPWLTVVGVSAEMRKTYSDSLYPDLYRPVAQAPRAYVALMIRTRVDPVTVEETVRRAVAAEDGTLALSNVEPMTAVLATARGRAGILARFVGGAAVVAFGLTLLGLYAVVAYLVRTRRREFAVRAALGARPMAIAASVLRDARGMLSVGIVLGILGALAAARLMQAQLVGISATDPLTYAVVALVVGTVSLAALAIPARAAGRADPAATLRDE